MNRKLVALAVVAGGVAVARRRSAASAASTSHPVATTTPTLPPTPAGRQRTVLTEDGVELAVTEHGATDATATVVLAHGYVQSSRLWAGQVRDLLDTRPDLRVVTYDHRGHGRSGLTPRERATLAQLGRDLAAVVDAVAPTGPVVVGGHSMGGMTIMALAEQRPELFGERIVGAAFVGTSAGALSQVTYGLPVPAARMLRKVLPKLNEAAVKAERKGKARKVGPMDARLIYPRGVDKDLVALTLDVHRETSAETVAAFLATFADHDRSLALSAIGHVPALVVVGDRDLLCPVDHSRAIHRAMPSSELVVFPRVGHMVHLERRAEVSRHLVALLDRAVPRTSATAA